MMHWFDRLRGRSYYWLLRFGCVIGRHSVVTVRGMGGTSWSECAICDRRL